MSCNNDGMPACGNNRPWLDDGDVRLWHGDVRRLVRELDPGSVQTCITSPPYWGLRDYGTATWEGGHADCHHLQHDDLPSQVLQSSGVTGAQHQINSAKAKYAYRDVCGRCGAKRVDEQIGMEPTFTGFIDGMVSLFDDIRNALADDGTCWVNMGDSYLSAKGASCGIDPKQPARRFGARVLDRPQEGFKQKDLIGQPWRLAFALQEAGWWLRSGIVWHKPNAMPESVTDRPSNAHEFLFLLAKSKRYYYDVDATRQPQKTKGERHEGRSAYTEDHPSAWSVRSRKLHPKGTNLRSVWSVNTSSYPGAHFATFPPELITPCVLAGSRPGDVVLDPFMGSGTTAYVARHHGRRAVGFELNEEYLRLAADRLGQQSLLAPGGAA